MAGCRIATPRRLEEGQEFELKIRLNSEDIVIRVLIIYWHNNGFAGLHFTSMSEEVRKRLQRWVEYISKNGYGTRDQLSGLIRPKSPHSPECFGCRDGTIVATGRNSAA
jgi:PilZ domain